MSDQLPLKIESLGKKSWTEALIDGFPKNWVSEEALQPKGNTYAMLGAHASNLQTINDYLVYGFDACRLDTAVGQALDYAAMDFYGNKLPRKTGEDDASYRQRIISGLFIPYTTKEAFIQAITALTGFAPRLVQGWMPQETAAYDWSYYDYNEPNRPSMYGDSNLPYQVFVTATLPSPTNTEQATAIWGYDAGAAYDFYTGTYWNLKAANFISQYDLDQLIMRIKAFGITVWRKYLSINSTPFPIPASFAVVANQFLFPISIQPFNGQFIVIASCNWNAQLTVTDITNDGFLISATSPTPASSTLNYVIIPLTQPEIVPGAGVLLVNDGDTSATLPAPVLPATPGNRAAIQANWPTNIWITSIAPGALSVEFSTPAPIGGTLSYFFFPPTRSALQFLSPDDILASAIFISAPGIPASSPFVTPSWNTGVAVTLIQGSGIIATFNTAPPAGAFVQWGYFAQG